MGKKLYKALHAITADRIYKKGETVELSDERAKAYGPKYVELVDAVEGEVVETNDSPDAADGQNDERRKELELMTINELKALIDENYPDADYSELASNKKAPFVDLVLELEAANAEEQE